MKQIIFLLVIMLGLGSCAELSDREIMNNHTEKSKKLVYCHEIEMSISTLDDMLVFDTDNDFKNAVKKLAANSYNQKPNFIESSVSDMPIYNTIMSLNNSGLLLSEIGFNSIYDDFVRAMKEAESYYDTEEGYKQFKEKYSNLYFPEYNDDYSAYLPVSDKNIAKLLNSNGDVMIEGKVVNLIDIKSYNQLVELGLTPPENSNLMKVSMAATDYPLNNLPETRCNNRKLWINCRVRPGSSTGVFEEIFFEVCFRKKGFLGAWYNYDSETTIGWESGMSWSKPGYSSHDYLWARTFQGAQPVPFRGLMYVIFRGFGQECGNTKYYFRVDL